jgi:hypothetical protein
MTWVPIASTIIVIAVAAAVLAVRAVVLRVLRQLADVRRQLAAYAERVDAVDARVLQVPGVTPGQRDWHVIVGGQKVSIKPLGAAEWLSAVGELPEFIYAFALERAKGERSLRAADAERLMALARKWIGACAAEEAELEHLTLPEAEHAVTHIAELNGITESLRRFFRERLHAMAGSASGGAHVRGETKQPNRPEPN